MNTTANLTRLNIENLTSMWLAAGTNLGQHHSNPFFSYSVIENSDWPNRLWFNQDLNEETVLSAKKEMLLNFPKLIVPHWETSEKPQYKILEQNGFTKIFEQIGMYLKVDKPYSKHKEMGLNLVSTKPESILWSQLFAKSFGYHIHPSILLETKNSIRFYIVSHLNKSVGTAITYQTKNVFGVHGVGIIPESRRNGLANLLMEQLVNTAIKEETEYITLQASAMGKGLYLKMGFHEQFKIKNYMLSQAE
tara:strand:- start:3812 stop:4558 length:747 start_codon:yes stop_codon:yes gene_type:complete